MTQDNAKRGLTNEDYWRLSTPTEFRLSPDGTRVAYTVNWLDEDTDTARSAIWLLELSTGASRRLTSGESGGNASMPTSGSRGGIELGGGDAQPRWSPDGSRLAFVGPGPDNVPQVFVQEVSSSDAHRLTDSPGGAFSPSWSPDGKAIAFMSAEPSEDHLVPVETAWLRRHPNAPAGAPRLRRITALKSRLEGRGFVDSRTHIFITGLDGDPPRRLTDGPFDDGPPAWSPDGTELVFSSSRYVDPELHLMNLCLLKLDSGDIRRLNSREMSEVHAPVFSPDGATIAYFGSPDNAERGYMQGIHLWVVSPAGGDDHNASSELDRQTSMTFHENFGLTPLEPPSWSPDGSLLYFNAGDHGDEVVFSVAPAGGPARRVSVGHAHALAPQLTPDARTIVCIAATPTRPLEICTVSAAGGPLVPLTDTNPWLAQEVDLVEPVHVAFKGPAGLDIDGWLIEPRAATPDSRYPLILHVHGGPYLAWGNTFYFQFQALAAAGFASLYVNPRGSAGYGQKFTCLRDYGKDDYRDLMMGVDAVLDRGRADPSRLGVTGLSFGGFMTNWIVGQTDRFAAALTINGISSWMAMQGSSDIGDRWPGIEWGGAYWDSDEMWEFYRERSPINYIANVKTPLLLFGSEKDYRVPIDQEELMLTALRVQGKVVEMIRFPNANHLIATSAAPHHRAEQWELAQAWFERWLD